MKKGGRITPTVAAIGTVLNIKPVLQIQGGKLDTFTKVRGKNQGHKAMIDAIKKDLEQKFVDIPVEKMHFAVAYSGARTAEVDAWVEEVKTVFPQATIEVVAPLSLSVSCHIGAGALAITLTAPIK